MSNNTDEALVEKQKECIVEMYKETWKVDEPREFQIDITHDVCFVEKPFIDGRPQVTAVIVKTGQGKSNVLLGSATVIGGLTLCVVPIVGLASDQLKKSSVPEHGIYAYNIHDLKPGTEATKRAMDTIKSLDHNQDRSVILFATPSDLVNEEFTFWRDVVYESIENKRLKLLCLDECHAIHEDGKDYRPEFLKLKGTLVKKLVDCKREIPVLAMSATFTTKMQNDFEEATGLIITEKIWGNMDRRSINLEVYIAYQVTQEWKKEIMPYLKESGTKVLLYTNSATAARNRLDNHISTLLQQNGITGDVMEFVGDKTSVLKDYMLRLFSGDLVSGNADLKVLIATKAANCGVHSSDCSLIIREGIPSSLQELVQEIGRLARGPRAESALPDKCYFALTIDLVLLSAVRVLKDQRVSQRRKKRDKLLKVLQLLVSPKRCLHVTLEEEFESPTNTRERHDCVNKCPHCRGEHLDFAGGAVRKDRLINALLVHAFRDGQPSTEELTAKIREKSTNIWADGKEPAVGKIQALLLQLLANEILEVYLDDGANKDDPSTRDIQWRWSVCNDGPDETYACYDDARWEGIHCASS